MGMRCDTALDGVDTLGSGDRGGVDTLESGSRGDCCVAGVGVLEE